MTSSIPDPFKESRGFIAERFLSIDLNWIAQRYGSRIYVRFAEAVEAAAEFRREFLQDLSIDFSPFVSVRCLCDQFPDYDFSSGEDLVDFIENRLPASEWISPHWLFDGKFYGSRYRESDSDKQVGYFEFLTLGGGQSRRPHPLFSPEWYARRCGVTSGAGTFFHFLQTGVFDDLSPTPLFDPAFYKAMYPHVGAKITNGTYSCSLEHFVIEGAEQGLLPSADWDPDYYLANNPDVAESVATGLQRSAFAHWLEYGIAENRAPNSQFDGRYYMENYPSVSEEIKRYDLLGSFEHFAMFGRQRRWWASAPLHMAAVPIEHAKALYLKRCELSVFRARTGGTIHFAHEERPFFSVIVPAHNKFAYNIRVLELLEHAVRYTKSKLGVGIEVVVIDDGSDDETVKLAEYAKGIVFRSVSPNIGFPRACNLGASLASGTYLVFLNNDVEFEPDVFVRLHEVVQADKAEVACFGAAILQFDGTIQDLGSGIWWDGVAQGHFRNELPTRYAFAYPRDVDYVAGCFFCISTDEFKVHGGFDERYSPGYYEESDLAMRLWRAGRRSRAYPDIRIYHLEFGAFSSGTTARASTALMARNRILFSREHRDLLERRAPFAANPGNPTGHCGVRPHLLFIEDRVPSLRLGSGYGRSEIIVRDLLEVADIDIFACYRENGDLIPTDFQYIEITYGPEVERLKVLLSSRHYDAVYVCRAHNLSRYRDVLAGWRNGGGTIVFDTEAIEAIREVARLDGKESYGEITRSTRFPVLLEDEHRFAGLADIIIAVNEFETAIVRERCNRPVYTIGHYLPIRPQDVGLEKRSGLLFVGALYDRRLANYDGLMWFLDYVWPRIQAARPEETLRIAGIFRPTLPLQPLQRHGVTFLGSVEDLTNEYASARVFIAPTRFAAGIPFKVHEALSYGLPVVSSSLLQDQLAHTGTFDSAVMAATVNDNGHGFSEACLRLLSDDWLWEHQHQSGLDYIARCCAPARLLELVRGLVRDLSNLRNGGQRRISDRETARLEPNR
jgi:GT2 family glycosyltransferase/glycosyltransferase involved in cell wall biosynthesis